MKKSYDYFKTFKLFSEKVYDSFISIPSADGIKEHRILFSGEKTELINNLKNEFITPIERGDIFILTECFSDELNYISNLNEYSLIFFSECELLLDNFRKSFEQQRVLFSHLTNSKNYDKLATQCQDSLSSVSSLKMQMYKRIKSVVLCNEAQPLLKYAVYVAFLELSKSLCRTFSETERILINNT